MHVVATAGHVDHGKSALVRALTGIEPDRWEQERRRGMTIDLGFAWTTLGSGEEVAFVDVPGHQRFLGNMLAGLGPAPAVVFVVAADEGWRQQSAEHLAAIDALGIDRGLLVVTRSDLADPAATIADASARLAGSSLGDCEAVAVSARTGLGIDAVLQALDRLVVRMPVPQTTGRVRLWVDRAFTIRGSGTVVTGTLGQGTLTVGDQLEVGGRAVTIRSLQALEQSREQVPAVARVAVNLRGVSTDEVTRGDALLTPGAWRWTASLDVRLGTADGLPGHAMLHVGTAAVEARIRPLGGDAARLTLREPLPLHAGDRAILRDPGARRIVAGVLVVDTDPPPLRRRGAAARRGEELGGYTGAPDLGVEVARRGALRTADAAALGLDVEHLAEPPASPSVRRLGEWFVSEDAWTTWCDRLHSALARQAAQDPLEPTLSLEAARAAAGVPDRWLLPQVAREAGAEVSTGRVGLAGVGPSLGARAESGLRAIEARLAEQPFAAPEAHELEAAGLGQRELAAAARSGRVLRLPDEVVLLPTAGALAMRVLAGLPQPFTTSDARQALGSTRRVVIPLLEHLDARGWTQRVDGSHRRVRR